MAITESGATTVDLRKILSDDNMPSNRDVEHIPSNYDIMVSFLRWFIEIGIFAGIYGFRNGEWLKVVFGTITLMIISTYCLYVPIKCSRELCLRTNTEFLNFFAVAETAFRTGPNFLQKYEKLVKLITKNGILISQVGFCCAYFIFAAAYLKGVLKLFDVEVSVTWCQEMVLIFVLLLNWVIGFKLFTPTLRSASMVMSTGLVIICLCIQEAPVPNSSIWKHLPCFFQMGVFAFEGLCIVLPFEKPRPFGIWNVVPIILNVLIVAGLYIAISLFHSVHKGAALSWSLEELEQVAGLTTAVISFISYAFQFYNPFKVSWPEIGGPFRDQHKKHYNDYLNRTTLIFISYLFARAIYGLEVVLPLIGAFMSLFLATIYPALIEIVTYWSDRLGRNYWMLWKNIAIRTFMFIGWFLSRY